MNISHENHACCTKKNQNIDYLFWLTLSLVFIGYVFHLTNFNIGISQIKVFNHATYEIMNKMWWGIVLGIFFVGLLELVPKDIINRLLGRDEGLKGIVRAAFAGIVFDLCSHGILLIAMKLYKKGVSLPQIMAFLIASPWNSISLTVILIALIGFGWTFLFILLSFLVAIVSGKIFQILIKKNLLPQNPHQVEIKNNKTIKELFKKEYEDKTLNYKFFFKTTKNAFKESEMILRWIFLGVIIASLIRAFMPDEIFTTYFGASMLGIFLTLIATTIIEVCSEGSVPIAADILTRAAAPGNAFVFLMAGVATDYTEILALKETTKSWKIALFLPLITVPQIVVLGYLINMLN